MIESLFFNCSGLGWSIPELLLLLCLLIAFCISSLVDHFGWQFAWHGRCAIFIKRVPKNLLIILVCAFWLVVNPLTVSTITYFYMLMFWRSEKLVYAVILGVSNFPALCYDLLGLFVFVSTQKTVTGDIPLTGRNPPVGNHCPMQLVDGHQDLDNPNRPQANDVVKCNNRVLSISSEHCS